jgi:hypothetical protein
MFLMELRTVLLLLIAVVACGVQCEENYTTDASNYSRSPVYNNRVIARQKAR